MKALGMLLSASETRGTVKAKKGDNLVTLWNRFVQSGSIQAYLKYQKAKLALSSAPSLKAPAKRKKTAV